MVKVTGTLQKSSEIMKLSSALIKLPQISQAMREMSMEMMKVRSLVSHLCLLNSCSFYPGRHNGGNA